MTEQGAVLFLDDEDGVWQLVTAEPDDPVRIWKTEKRALRDLASDGWKIDGPYRMCPKNPALPQIWVTGYGLTRLIQ